MRGKTRGLRGRSASRAEVERGRRGGEDWRAAGAGGGGGGVGPCMRSLPAPPPPPPPIPPGFERKRSKGHSANGTVFFRACRNVFLYGLAPF